MLEMANSLSVCVSLLAVAVLSGAAPYVLDDSHGLGRRFDGIGGLSGGGVSQLLAQLAHRL